MTIWFLVSNKLVNNNNIFYIAIKVNYFLCLYDDIQENEGKLKRYMTDRRTRSSSRIKYACCSDTHSHTKRRGCYQVCDSPHRNLIQKRKCLCV